MSLASCSLSPVLLRVPLLPEPSVATDAGLATGQALRSLGNDLDVVWVRDVVQAVPAQRPGLNPPSMVNGLRHGLKVIGIHATADPAKVINLESTWHGTSVMDPEGSRRNGLPVKNPTQDPVTVAVYRSLPEPASVAIDDVPGPVVDEGFGHVPDSNRGGM